MKEKPVTIWRRKMRADRWLRNQNLSPIGFVRLIQQLEKIHYTPSLGDIETSLNLSYSDSDAGETP